jgi:hypothetical protein
MLPDDFHDTHTANQWKQSLENGSINRTTSLSNPTRTAPSNRSRFNINETISAGMQR